MTLAVPLYEGKAGSPASGLSANYIAGVSTEIYLDDISVVPDSVPNLVTVMSGDKSIYATIRYDEIYGHSLKGLTVIRGTGQIFYAGSAVATRNYTYEDDYALKANLVDHESRISALEQGGEAGGIKGVSLHGETLEPSSEGVVDIPEDVRRVLIGTAAPTSDVGANGDLYYVCISAVSQN